MKVIADDQTRKGVYTNIAFISHRREEFVLDFLFGKPLEGDVDSEALALVARVIMSPEHFKRLHRAMEEQIAKYEQNYGGIWEYDAGKDSKDKQRKE